MPPEKVQSNLICLKLDNVLRKNLLIGKKHTHTSTHAYYWMFLKLTFYFSTTLSCSDCIYTDGCEWCAGANEEDGSVNYLLGSCADQACPLNAFVAKVVSQCNAAPPSKKS